MPPFPSDTLSPAPFWQTGDGLTARLWAGDAATVLRRLPAGSVHCCVTSPPYWGLRDYGTGTWEGGSADCDHRRPSRGGTGPASRLHVPGIKAHVISTDNRYPDKCPKCGARRIDLQLGSEPFPDCGTRGQAQCGGCFVCSMVAVFRGVRRVLRDDGTCWLNLGDTYAGGGTGGVSAKQESNPGSRHENRAHRTSPLPSGNLVGVPWRVALALQADGWVLRQDIIWHKPSPMPESVTNRCTKAHEYVFLLTKKQGYFYDAEAIKDASVDRESLEGRNPRNPDQFTQVGGEKAATRGGFAQIEEGKTYPTKNKRSVWTVSAQGYPGAHFATFPPKLIEPMIKAGTSERGCCAKCGAPWRRVTEETRLRRSRPNDYVKRTGAAGTGNSCANTVAGVEMRTVGWEPSCACVADIVPCTVLDPFVGSGTAVAVAVGLGRRGWGIDLSEDYLRRFAVPRVGGVLLARPALARLVTPAGGTREVSGGSSETAAAGPVGADGEGWF